MQKRKALEISKDNFLDGTGGVAAAARSTQKSFFVVIFSHQFLSCFAYVYISFDGELPQISAKKCFNFVSLYIF